MTTQADALRMAERMDRVAADGNTVLFASDAKDCAAMLRDYADGLKGDDFICCNGNDCGCRGATNKEYWAHMRQVDAKPLSEYHEDQGCALWFTWTGSEWLGEPSWIGTPDDSDWPGYHTHWIPHPEFPPPLTAALSGREEGKGG